MDMDNHFDRALKVRAVREPFLSAAVEVTDTLDLAWASARAVFGDGATPEHAIAITGLMLQVAGRIPHPRHADTT